VSSVLICELRLRAWRLGRLQIRRRGFGNVLARGVLRAVVMVGVLSVATRGARTSVSVLSLAAFGAVVPVCVWFVVCMRQQLAQADWPDPGSFLFNLRAASRLATRWAKCER